MRKLVGELIRVDELFNTKDGWEGIGRKKEDTANK
jgi:hypothetical protein